MQKRTLSVIMPNYNDASYLGEALEAILSQSYRPMEVIIIDDASTDNSVEIIQQFVKRDSIVRLIRNKKNLGGIHNANRLLGLIKGDYVYTAAADDRIHPYFFEKSMNLLTQYPQAGLCCGDSASLDSRTGIERENRLQWSKTPRYFSPEELSPVIREGYIAGVTALIKRCNLLAVGGWLPQLRWHCDWFTLLVIAFRYGICYIPESLATIRVRSDSYSASGRRKWPLQREVLKVLLHLLKSPAYRDVLPYFIHSNSLSHFDGEIVRVVIGSPQNWNLQSLRLIRQPLWNEFRRILSSILPPGIKRGIKILLRR